MIERLLLLAYRYLRRRLFHVLPPKWQVAYLIVEGAAKHLLRLRLRFLAVGIFAPMAAFAVLAALVKVNGQVPMTPEVVEGLRRMVGIQVVCGILAFLEMAYNDSDPGGEAARIATGFPCEI